VSVALLKFSFLLEICFRDCKINTFITTYMFKEVGLGYVEIHKFTKAPVHAADFCMFYIDENKGMNLKV